MILQLLSAMVGAVTFSALFGAPRQHYLCCGLIGAAGWLVYLLVDARADEAWACMLASMAVIFLARLAAVARECPAPVFLLAGIFPLVPGAGIYRTTYYLVFHQMGLAGRFGYSSLKAAVAIVLGMVIIFEIPQKFFKWLAALPVIREIKRL